MQFYQPKELPKIMVAPNGVRPMKKDHPKVPITIDEIVNTCLLYTSPSPRDATLSRMPSSA